MQAYFFGDASRRCLACFHPADPSGPVASLPAVLLCGPQGQEGVRAHRLLRVLAERLARNGHDVLRFDPYGTGDSAGDDEELDLPGWQRDVALAAQALHHHSPGRSQVWLGFRLGATVACLAALASASASAGARPAKLLLVEPVLDGPAYLDELALATVRLLEASMSLKDPAWRQSLKSEPQAWQREAAGFGLGPALHAQLRDLNPLALELGADVAVEVVGPAAASQTRAHTWPDAPFATVAYEFDWTAEEALNSALVPHALVAHLLAQAGHIDVLDR